MSAYNMMVENSCNNNVKPLLFSKAHYLMTKSNNTVSIYSI